MARPGRPERNRAARSFRQLRRFHHISNSDRVFGTHRSRGEHTVIKMALLVHCQSAPSLGSEKCCERLSAMIAPPTHRTAAATASFFDRLQLGFMHILQLGACRRTQQRARLDLLPFARTARRSWRIHRKATGAVARRRAPVHLPSDIHFNVASHRSWPRCMRLWSVSRRCAASLPLPTSSVTTRQASPCGLRYQVW